MIAIITNDKLADINDITLLSVTGYLLKQKKQSVVTHKEIDFGKLTAGESLYFVQHGSPGYVGDLFAVANDGNPGISQLIGKAIKKDGVKKCPAQITLYVCNSALDLMDGNNKSKSALKKSEGFASMVRGVSLALAKHAADHASVTGCLGPAVLDLAQGTLHVAIVAKLIEKGPSQTETNTLLSTYGFPAQGSKFEAHHSCFKELQEKDFAKRAIAVCESKQVKAFNSAFIARVKAGGAFYTGNTGIVTETAKDGQKYLEPK